jgi:hypothetical protein
MMTIFDDDAEEVPSFFPKQDEWCSDYSLEDLIRSAYVWQGEHHKKYWIAQIAARLELELEDDGDPGVPP